MSFQNAHIISRNTNSADYREAHNIPRGDPKFPVSPSMLKLFAPCAKKWLDGYTPKDTKAKKWGNLLDTLLLTPDQFSERYAVIPDDAPRKPNSRQREARRPSADTLLAIEWWDDWNAKNEGKIVIDEETHELASAAIMRLQADPTVKAFVEQSDTQVWVAGEWNDKDTGLVIPVRCLIDLEPRGDSEFGKCLGDLKSTRSAALRPFLRDAFNMGHHIQAAFDMDLYRAAEPERDIVEWCLIVQENYEPWQVGRRLMTDDPTDPTNFLDLGRLTYKRMLRNYCVCLKTGVWPDFDAHENAVQGWSPMRAEAWMVDGIPELMEMPEGEAGEPEEAPADTIP